MANNEEVKVNSISELEFPKNEKKYLGEGASGCVKLVRHKRLDKYFALKQMSVEKQNINRVSQEKKVETDDSDGAHQKRNKASQAAHPS